MYFQKKLRFQRRALIRKNLTLQWRQKYTNLCQLLSPILGLLIVVIFKEIGVQSLLIFADKSVFVPVPQIFGMNLKGIAAVNDFVKVTTCDQWYMYEFDKEALQQDKDFFGYNDGLPYTRPNSSGILNTRNLPFSQPCNEINRTVPYFEEYSQHLATEPKDMTEQLGTKIKALNTAQMDYKNKNYHMPELDLIPDGAYSIKQANDRVLKYNMHINNLKYWQYHRNNGITKLGVYDNTTNTTSYNMRTIEGALAIADVLNSAYMKQLFGDVTVLSGVNFYPFELNFEKEAQRCISVICVVVLPLCMCMGLPVFIYQIVLEKETRLLENMKINGLRMSNYWIVSYALNFLFYSITASFFVLFGSKIFEIKVFVETSPLIILLTLIGWGLAQISQAFFISAFLNKTQNSTIVGYTTAVWLTAIATAANITVYSPPNQMASFAYIIPQFTFARILMNISWSCGYTHCYTDFMGMNSEMFNCIIALYVTAVLYMLLALYCYEVVPQTYGVPKKWNYLCLKSKRSNGRDLENTENEIIHEDQENGNRDFKYDLSLEDQDAKAMRQEVYDTNENEYYKYPLVVKDMSKLYPGFGGRPAKPAVKKFCLKVNKGETFGLLGPNGAGKTTLISMLTGMYRPSGGNAWVAGYDIKDQLEIVQLQIGVCPQFDILWGDLTVEEHLYFYARLKGISPEKEAAQVTKAINEVLLQKYRTFQVSSLSGGMKRRLSVAIALVSDPKIVFLDEPSTGLDPENRRQLWDILSACKGNRALILTTHSMEEADVLCNRIGIVTDGVLRCVGPQVRLKSLYGGGYNLFINCQRGKVLQLIKQMKNHKLKKQIKEKQFQLSPVQINELDGELNNDSSDDDFTITNRLQDFIKKLVPNIILIRGFNGMFVYQIPTQSFKADSLFVALESNKARLRITDWGISQSSLEDVFSRICETS